MYSFKVLSEVLKVMIDPKYYPLIANLLEMASDYFANRSANDYDLKQILPDVEDRRQLVQDMEMRNGSPEEFDPLDDYEIVSDSWLMGYFADVFKEFEQAPVQPYHRSYQELILVLPRLCALLESMKSAETSRQQILDDILTIQECLTRAEFGLPS